MLQIKTILQSQRDFFATGKTKDLDFRIEQLKILRHAISEYEEKILKAVYNDLHRPKFDAYITETGACYEHISHTLGNLKKWARPKKVKGPRAICHLAEWGTAVLAVITEKRALRHFQI